MRRHACLRKTPIRYIRIGRVAGARNESASEKLCRTGTGYEIRAGCCPLVLQSTGIDTYKLMPKLHLIGRIGSIKKENRLLRMGVLGAGLIAQAAHLKACKKARNIELYALCDSAADLVTKVASTFEPSKTYTDADALLAEGFADVILKGVPPIGAQIEGGLAALRALSAISHSVKTGERVLLAETPGNV